MSLVALLLTSTTFAGYGDAVDGLPTPAEREMHAWTNMVRVDPEAFISDYDCSFDGFKSEEKTPKRPFMWNLYLNQAANYHSGDMLDYDYFDHDSIDGTSWSSRIHRYYTPGTIGENIAWGYGDVYSAVIEGWMCSSGHRANMMKDSYDEMGPGVAERYYTQDFGYGGVATQPIAMGIHMPTNPQGEVELVADFYAGGAEPTRFEAVIDGEAHGMELILGVPSQGAWWVKLPTDDDCHLYYFEAEVAAGQTARFPTDGSYGWGDCDFDDPRAMWSDLQIEPGEDPTDEGTDDPGDPTSGGTDPTDLDLGADNLDSAETDAAGCGCNHPAPFPIPLYFMPLLLVIRRNRSAPVAER